MSLSTLLSHLDRVKETGTGKYMARCPAHDDRSPSLSIAEVDGGKVLVNCLAGCETESVLATIGLTFSDLMPERIGSGHRYKPTQKRVDARQVLGCVSHEVVVICLLAEKMLRRETLTSADDERLTLAAQRLNAALEYAPPLKTPPELLKIRSGAA